MSKFYARITQSARRTVPTARGHHGVTVWAQSHEGSVRVEMCEHNGKAAYRVTLHEGSAGGFKREIARGYADGSKAPSGALDDGPGNVPVARAPHIAAIAGK